MDNLGQNYNDFQEKILKDLSKYQLYEKLNEDCGKCEHCAYCQHVKSSLNIYGKDLYKLCCIFAKNLITLTNILKNEIVEDDYCKHFNFWIHYEIIKRLKSNEISDNNIGLILTRLLQVHHKIQLSSKPNICHFNYNRKIDLNLWEKFKDLYDYTLNFDDIKSKIANDHTLCPIYLKYLEYIESAYKDFKNECCNDSEKCPNKLNLKDWCTKNDILHKLPCEESKAVAPEFLQDEGGKLLEKPQEGHRPHSVISLSREPGSDINEDGITNNTDYYAKLGISFSFLGVLSTFFYLYNFTTFGNWIRSKVLQQKINLNLDQDEQNLMEHNLNKDNEIIYTDGYNITYQSS
ncbi:PIR Superfamily Protein [Plasmodium ovale wallikeri]|uniref:PIR protein n=2 Tax=Plasmodium ovale TaxID=36330 RepID=A0A1C3KGA1_PLAOA|nr:PIR Superfamily Protein [Plasmodium ovale wallikeri]SBT72715.1 PIR protein [Plasmodium ovale]